VEEDADTTLFTALRDLASVTPRESPADSHQACRPAFPGRQMLNGNYLPQRSFSNVLGVRPKS
jgi:hypothetical protein